MAPDVAFSLRTKSAAWAGIWPDMKTAPGRNTKLEN